MDSRDESKTIAAFSSSDRLPVVATNPCTSKSESQALETIAHADSTNRSHLQVRCPGCRASLEVAPQASLTELVCESCGSHFNLLDHATATWAAPTFSKMGRFELVEQLGMGAFGTVWKARDNELDRTVAIKVPRRTSMTPDEVEKFFREARTAAQLRHPNIVSVHEVGRDGDSVYIVSDLVRGITLDDWLTGQQPNSREAARLCATIADALQHAHQQGVIHRDLKPANIMIDGDGEPHLMDFGLARREVGEVTMTMDGQVLGTPAYMSPEQAQGEAHSADARSDIYSLGVILFQLLTGELPFRGNPRMLMHQVIHEEPPSPRKFNASISKDLETITLKCLEKDPSRRFAAAREFSAELKRFLSGEPILARPISRPERAIRWMRRNKVVTLLSSAVAALLVIGIVVSSWQAYRATRAEALARQRLAAETRAHAEASAARADAEANFQQAMNAVNELLTEVGHESLADVPQMEPLRRALLEKALGFYQDFMRKRSDDPRLRHEMARALHHVSDIYFALGEMSLAEQTCRQAIDAFVQLESQLPDEPQHQYEAARSYSHLGKIISYTANEVIDGGNKAQSAFRHAIERNERLAIDFPDDPKYRHSLANDWSILGERLAVDGDPQGGAKAIETAIDLHEKLSTEHSNELKYCEALGIHHRRLAELYHRYSLVSEAQRSYRRGIDIQRALLAKAPSVASYRKSLAHNLSNYGCLLMDQPRQAETTLREAASLQKLLVRDFPDTWEYRWQLTHTLDQLGKLLSSENRLEDAKREFQDAADYYAPTVPYRLEQTRNFPEEQRHRVWLAAACYRLAELLMEGGREQEAIPYLDQALILREKLYAESPLVTAHLASAVALAIRLGSLLEQYDDGHSAAQIYLRMAKLLEQPPHPSDDITVNATRLNKFAWRITNVSNPQFRDPARAIEIVTLALERSDMPTAWNTLGVAQFRAGNSQAAIDTLKKSIELRNGGDSFDFFFLAMAFWQQGKPEDARRWYNKGVEWMDAQQPNDSQLLQFRKEASHLLGIESTDNGPSKSAEVTETSAAEAVKKE